MRVVTRLVFAEACWVITAAVLDVHYELPSVAAAAVAGVLPDADYPKSWTGRMLGSVSEGLHRFFGHRSFLHSYLALALVTATIGPPLWWLADHPAPLLAVFVGYGSRILADMMTVGGVQFFWPSRVIAVFPGRDEYRVLSGSTSERVFVALALLFALLFYPVSKVGFDGLIYRMGGAETSYATVVEVLDGGTLKVDTQGSTVDVRLLGVDTPETVAPDQPIGCYGPEASEFTKKTLPGKPPDLAPGEVLPTGHAPSPATGRVAKLEVPRISERLRGRLRTHPRLRLDRSGRRRLLRAPPQRGPPPARLCPYHLVRPHVLAPLRRYRGRGTRGRRRIMGRLPEFGGVVGDGHSWSDSRGEATDASAAGARLLLSRLAAGRPSPAPQLCRSGRRAGRSGLA